MSRLTREEFSHLIQRALRHLYEPAELQRSPLGRLMGLNNSADLPSRLRQALLEAIHALKPEPRVPLDSNAWRVYQVLCYRYEEQAEQEEVASQMAVSTRQVRRLEHTALEALVEYLVKRYSIPLEETQEAATPVEASTTEPAAPPSAGRLAPGEQEHEFDWLRRSYAPQSTTVADLVYSSLETGKPLLQASGCKPTITLDTPLPNVQGQMTVLRQALLNLLIAASRIAPDGCINVSAQEQGEHVLITITAQAEKIDGNQGSEYIQMASQIVAVSGGSISQQMETGRTLFTVAMRLPTIAPIPLLVIDDNEDIVRLVERYLEGTPYRVQSGREGHTVLELAERENARIIVLDIMLPGVDGWEVLGRIRAHPRLGSVPVIISTILPYEELSRSLGATGFLRKPFSRDALLAVLNEVTRKNP